MTQEPFNPQHPITPRDFALWLLASGAASPRQRARSQRADVAGLALKRQVLQRLIALDPEPQGLDIALQQMVAEIGPPTGPIRAVAETIRAEWDAACRDSEFTEYLLGEATLERDKRTGSH